MKEDEEDNAKQEFGRKMWKFLYVIRFVLGLYAVTDLTNMWEMRIDCYLVYNVSVSIHLGDCSQYISLLSYNVFLCDACIPLYYLISI